MLSSRTFAFVVGIVAVAAITGAVVARRSTGPTLEVLTPKEGTDERAGLCPWRNPEGDMKRYFPGATGYRTQLLVLSRKREEILRRLGPGHKLESFSLYIYPVQGAKGDLGTVCVRRAAGRYGAIELVVALDEKRQIVGVRVQRQREPKATSDLLTNGNWLEAFKGKDVLADFNIGRGLPVVPKTSRELADAVADAVRSVLIEVDEGTADNSSHH